MIFLIYTILVALQQYKGISTVVPDPCPANIQQSIAVVDMCKTQSAEEDQRHGSDNVDSVLLRIMIQQNNCICRVTIDNQIQPIHIGLGKYGGFTDSAPEDANCGLAVDITHTPDISTGDAIAPIECMHNVGHRSLQLLQNRTLQFKSRILNGSFTRGYCMRLQRDGTSDHSQILRMDCDAVMTTEQTTHQIIQSDPTTDTSGRPTGDTTITSPEADTSTNDVSPSITTATDPTTGNTINTVNQDNAKSQGIEQTTYIAIGAGSGVALILLVVLLIICLRRKSTHKAGTNGNVNKSDQPEESLDELQDNVLYVPATEFDITGGRLSKEGSYSTVDDETQKIFQKRLSVEGNYSTVDVDTQISSNNRVSMEGNYSTVDVDTPKSSNKRLSMDGNYSTVELAEHLNTNMTYPANLKLGQTKGKQKPAIKPKSKSSWINSEENHSPDQNITHITPPNGSNNVYAIVDKSVKIVPTSDGGKREGTCQHDQTYAVVDKVRKRKSSADDTNKKKFEIHSGNKV